MDIQYKGVIAGLLIVLICSVFIIMIAQNKKADRIEKESLVNTKLMTLLSSQKSLDASVQNLNTKTDNIVHDMVVLSTQDKTVVVDSQAIITGVLQVMRNYVPVADCTLVETVGNNTFIMNCMKK